MKTHTPRLILSDVNMCSFPPVVLHTTTWCVLWKCRRLTDSGCKCTTRCPSFCFKGTAHRSQTAHSICVILRLSKGVTYKDPKFACIDFLALFPVLHSEVTEYRSDLLPVGSPLHSVKCFYSFWSSLSESVLSGHAFYSPFLSWQLCWVC